MTEGSTTALLVDATATAASCRRTAAEGKRPSKYGHGLERLWGVRDVLLEKKLSHFTQGSSTPGATCTAWTVSLSIDASVKPLSPRARDADDRGGGQVCLLNLPPLFRLAA